MRRRIRGPARGTAGAYPVDQFRLKVALGVTTTAVVVTLFALGILAIWPRATERSFPKAVIVDQLALTDPNPAFVDAAAAQLKGAGYVVDYIPPEAVTVDLYRQLPKEDYQLIILRSHSAQNQNVGDVQSPQYVRAISLFTNELYSTRSHVDEQRQGRLWKGSLTGAPVPFFTIRDEFVREAMEGDFDGATIIMMGCGVSEDNMASAFIDKGAKQFVSWDAAVSASHTDAAATELLDALLTRHLDVREAVAQTMAKVGPDPAFGARLLSYE